MSPTEIQVETLSHIQQILKRPYHVVDQRPFTLGDYQSEKGWGICPLAAIASDSLGDSTTEMQVLEGKPRYRLGDKGVKHDNLDDVLVGGSKSWALATYYVRDGALILQFLPLHNDELIRTAVTHKQSVQQIADTIGEQTAQIETDGFLCSLYKSYAVEVYVSGRYTLWLKRKNDDGEVVFVNGNRLKLATIENDNCTIDYTYVFKQRKAILTVYGEPVMEESTLKQETIDRTVEDLRVYGYSSGCTDDETFFVERHFMNYKMEGVYSAVGYVDRDLGNFSAGGTAYDCLIIRIFTSSYGVPDPNHNYFLHYFGGSGGYMGPGHGLAITDEKDNLLYWRKPGENEKTEWQLNCMAGNLTDENGKLIFNVKQCNA